MLALTHWGRDKMAAISQRTVSNAFSWMKMYQFRLRFHWSLIPKVQITIFQHWLRYWLGAVQATSHYLNQWWSVFRRIHVSLGLNELIAVKDKNIIYTYIYTCILETPIKINVFSLLERYCISFKLIASDADKLCACYCLCCRHSGKYIASASNILYPQTLRIQQPQLMVIISSSNI